MRDGRHCRANHDCAFGSQHVAVGKVDMIKIDWKKLRAYTLVVALAISGTVALMPGKPVVAQGRSLPDFTALVERVGPSVVNIRTIERARGGAAATGQMD